MKKTIRILPFLLFIFLIDRFLFLPGRMDNSWEYEKGTFMGDLISFENIEIINNFKIRVNQAGKQDSCYLLGCYFGNLYLLDAQTLEYTKYTKSEGIFENR